MLITVESYKGGCAKTTSPFPYGPKTGRKCESSQDLFFKLTHYQRAPAAFPRIEFMVTSIRIHDELINGTAVSQDGKACFGTVERMHGRQPILFRGRHFRSEVIVLCVRWYLRYPLSYRDLEEMMAERGLSVDHSTIARWVLHYAPILSRRIRREMRQPNRSWRVDETYVRVAGKWTYLYRAIDSRGDTIEFLLSPNRDLIAAKGFLRLALSAGQVRPRVINVDGHPAYASAIGELKQNGELGRRCRCRPSPYLNNVIEQDHRFVKKRVIASQGFRSVAGALSTIAGYEAMNIIRKGQIRWLPKGDAAGQKSFVERIFAAAA